MEERKVNIVQRHKQELLYKIFHWAPITLRIQVICITINILYYSKCIRIQTDTTILSSQPLEYSTFSHPCASLWNKILAQLPEDYIDVILNLTRRPVSRLKTFSQKDSQSQKETHYRNCIAVEGSIGNILQTPIIYKKFYMKDNGFLCSRFSFFGWQNHYK